MINVVRLLLLFNIGCVILSHPQLYEQVKHIRILRIMGRIGGADYNDKKKRAAKLLAYLNSEECMKKCDSIPIYNMILIARLFLSEANYARLLNESEEVEENRRLYWFFGR